MKNTDNQNYAPNGINKVLVIFEEIISITFFVVMLTLMVVQVLFRYVLKIPLAWSEELIRYLFVVTSFFGAAIASFERNHIEINLTDFFLGNTKNRVRSEGLLWLIADMITFLIIVVFAYLTFDHAYILYETKQISCAMGMPMFWVVGAMFIGSVLMAIHYLYFIVMGFWQYVFTSKEGN